MELRQLTLLELIDEVSHEMGAHLRAGYMPNDALAINYGLVGALQTRALMVYEELQKLKESSSHTFQQRVKEWATECFGEQIAKNKLERNHRLLEEVLELVQTNGCTREEAHQLVDYVFARPPGELEQEVGGTMTTLASLCNAVGLDMHVAADKELARAHSKIDLIRNKQKRKPKHGPLPV